MKILQILTVIMLSMVFGLAVAFGLEVQPDVPVSLSMAGGLVSYFTPVGHYTLGLFDYGGLNWSPGVHNTPGMQQIGYFIPKAHITGWPVFDAATNSYTGAFTLDVGKFWNPIYGTHEKGKVDWETQGETDNESILNKANWSHPGQKGEVLAFAANAVKDDLVYAFMEADGAIRIIGDEHFKTITKATGSTGDARSSAKATTLEISCVGETPAPIYSDLLPTE